MKKQLTFKAMLLTASLIVSTAQADVVEAAVSAVQEVKEVVAPVAQAAKEAVQDVAKRAVEIIDDAAEDVAANPSLIERAKSLMNAGYDRVEACAIAIKEAAQNGYVAAKDGSINGCQSAKESALNGYQSAKEYALENPAKATAAVVATIAILYATKQVYNYLTTDEEAQNA